MRPLGRNALGRKAAKAAPGERPASHQLDGGVTDHRGYDGYPA